MKISVFTLCLALFFSPSLRASNTCSVEETYKYKSIECCISDDLTIETCKSSIDKFDPGLVKLIEAETKKIQNNFYKKGEAPNCFWNSTGFHFKNLRTPARTWYEYQFSKQLEESFVEVDLDKTEYGSIVYYDGPQAMYPDHLNGESVTIDIPFHSGILVGNDLIFQKENSSDHVFSLTTFKRSFEGYKKAYFESTEEVLIPRFFNIK